MSQYIFLSSTHTSLNPPPPKKPREKAPCCAQKGWGGQQCWTKGLSEYAVVAAMKSPCNHNQRFQLLAYWVNPAHHAAFSWCKSVRIGTAAVEVVVEVGLFVSLTSFPQFILSWGGICQEFHCVVWKSKDFRGLFLPCQTQGCVLGPTADHGGQTGFGGGV